MSTIKNKNILVSALDRFIWMDLEMTGLNVLKCKILEVACIITTPNLNPLHEGINLVVHEPDALESMNEWSLKQHEKSGLLKASRESKINIEEADHLVADYIKQHTRDKGLRYLAGNSVYMDKQFINKYMPCTSSLLHYRILDISSIKILCSQWFPDVYSSLPEKKLSHRALDDILESIEELKNYKKTIFKT